jgi:hypothetical protein
MNSFAVFISSYFHSSNFEVAGDYVAVESINNLLDLSFC